MCVSFIISPVFNTPRTKEVFLRGGGGGAAGATHKTGGRSPLLLFLLRSLFSSPLFFLSFSFPFATCMYPFLSLFIKKQDSEIFTISMAVLLLRVFFPHK